MRPFYVVQVGKKVPTGANDDDPQKGNLNVGPSTQVRTNRLTSCWKYVVPVPEYIRAHTSGEKVQGLSVAGAVANLTEH